MEDEVRYVERKVAAAGCDEDIDLCASRFSELLVADVFDEDGSSTTELNAERERACFSTSTASRKSNYGGLIARIESALQRAECQPIGVMPQGGSHVANKMGRIGDQTVIIDSATIVGNTQMDADRLGLVGASDFSTVRANCAVYAGKWMYEALLGTRGVMQFGWCTLECQFSEEKGVGDTPSSYAYDGNRLRKWNMTTERYGEPWFAGDVIGCAIDLDAATISFYRNGRALGTAFTKVPVGPGLAYFPAFSLSLTEAVRLNFGALPFLHPIAGYQPLQSAPLLEEAAAAKLTSFLERVLIQLSAVSSSNPLLAHIAANSLSNAAATRRVRDADPVAAAAATGTPSSSRASAQPGASARTLLHLSAYHVLQHLATYFMKSYHVHSCLVGMLVRLHKMCLSDASPTVGSAVALNTAGASVPSTSNASATCVHKPAMQAYIDLICYMLDLFWTFLHESEVTQCLEHLLVALLTLYRYSPVPLDFATQKHYLQIVLAVLSHTRSRRFLLSHVLFDRVRFPLFLHIKPPDDGVLEQLIPHTWLIFAHKQEDLADARFTRSDERKAAYLRGCAALQKRLGDIQQLQTELLKLLLRDDDDDPSATASACPAAQSVERAGGSRAIFLRKLRAFMAENYPTNARTAHLAASQCPIPVVLCFLHHLIRAISFYYQRLYEQVHAAASSSAHATQSLRSSPATAAATIGASPFFSPTVSPATPRSHSSSAAPTGTLPNSPLASSAHTLAFYSAASRNSPVRHKLSADCATPTCSRLLSSTVGSSSMAALLPPLAHVHIPICKFYDPMLSHLDVQRLGGLASYLKKTYRTEVEAFEKQRMSLNSALRSVQQLTVASEHVSVRRRTVDSPPQLSTTYLKPTAANATHHHKTNTARSLFSSIFPFASSTHTHTHTHTHAQTNASPSALSACTSPPSYPPTPICCVPQSPHGFACANVAMAASPYASSNAVFLPSTSSSVSSASPACHSPSTSAAHCPVTSGTTAAASHAERDFDAAHSSLLALIDSCVLLYHIGAHKQNGKMAALRENMRDYYLAYCDTEAKLARCGTADTQLRACLEHTRSVFETKLAEDSRHMAWILAVVFVEQNRTELYWLLRVLLTTIKRARQAGHLYSLLPDYYMETVVNLYHALCNYFHPTLDVSTLEHFESTLVDFGKFLVKNTNDKRIVTHDVKDKLLQALCAFASYRLSLKALERLSLKTYVLE